MDVSDTAKKQSLDAADVDEAATPPPPPPAPSTVLIVDRAPDAPALCFVDATSMSVQWSPVSITVSTNERRVVEYLQTYLLQMQQVEAHNSDVDVQPDVKDGRWSIQYSGPATYVQVKGLRPGRNYAVRVVCNPKVTDPKVSVQLADPSDLLLVSTPPTPPSAPAPPTLAVRQRNSLKFKWSEPVENGGHPILAYVLECHPPPEGFQGKPTSEGMFEIYRGLDRSLVVKKLLPGVRYSSRVKAINCIGESPFSALSSFTTQATVPCVPESPVVSSSGHDSVVLRWPSVAGNGSEVTGYQVMMDDGHGGEFNFVGHTNSPQFSMGDLRSGLPYRFRILAENSEGRSQWSVPCVAQTAATPPLPPPAPIKDASTHSSISISWRPPEYDGGVPLTGYQVEIHPKCSAAKRGMPEQWVLMYTGLERSCTLSGLCAGCTYKSRVRAVNEKGVGAFSFPTDVATSAANPEAPGPPSASTRFQDALLVHWTPPQHDGGSPVLSYRLCLRPVGFLEQRQNQLENGDSSSFHTAYDGAECSAEISGLEAGRKYEFKVSATNRQGTSPWSAISVLATRPGLPLTPAPPSAVPGAVSRTLELQWTRPYGNGAPVDSFVVQMQQQQVAADKPLPSSSSSSLKVNGVVNVSDTDDDDDANGSATAATASAPTHEGSIESSNEQNMTPLTATVRAVETEGHEEKEEEKTTTPSSPPSFVTVYHSSDLRCTVTDLEHDSDYVFRLRAFNSVGASAWSEHLLLRTPPAPPSPPLHLQCSTSTSSSLSFTWQPPEKEYGAAVTSYQLEYVPLSRSGGGGTQRAAEKAAWRSAFQGSTLQYKIESLRPGQQYNARVRALNACGWGLWSEVLTAVTAPDVPSAPAPPSTSGRSGSTVRLSWSPPLENNGAAVTEYELQMAALSEKSSSSGDGGEQGIGALCYVTLVNGIDTTWKAGNLAPGADYVFRVRAANAVGFGPWSAVKEVTTSLMPPLEPVDVQAVVDETGGAGGAGAAVVVIVVKWTTPAAAPLRAGCTSYEIECSSSGGARGGKSAAPPVKHTCSGKVTQYKLSSLKAGSMWSIRIRAIGADGAGHGAWSAPVTILVPSNNAAAAAGGGTSAAAGISQGKRGSAASEGGGVGASVFAALGSSGVQQQLRHHLKGGGGGGGDSMSGASSVDLTHEEMSQRNSVYGKSRGSKIAVAKSKPRPKTILSTVARAIGVNESSMKSIFYAMIIMTFLATVVLMNLNNELIN